MVMKEEEITISSRPLTMKQKLPQYVASTAATMASFCAGCALGWTSPISGRLLGMEGTYAPLERPVTMEEWSWVSSLVAFGAIFGPLCGGIFIDRFGRKKTLMVMGGIPAIVGWILIIAARNPTLLYIGRFFAGISTGSASTLGPVYIAEVASPSERGTLCSMPQLMITFGIMLQFTLGPYVSYEVLAGTNLVFPVVFLVSLFLMPESPYYLMANDQKEEAEASLLWFRGGGKRKKGDRGPVVDVSQELEAISVAVEESGIKDSSLLDSFKDVFSTKGNRRAFLVTSILMASQQLSGINAVLFNAEMIFGGSNKEKPLLKANESTMVIGAVQIVASWVETVLADRAGRRPLILISCLFSAVSLAALGAHSYTEYSNPSALPSLTWLPIVSLVGFIIFYCLGLGPLPWAVLGEVFPSTSKSAAGIMSGSFCWVLGFVVPLTFHSLIVAMRYYGVYWLYTGCCLAAFASLYVLLPETKCKTLEQIQKELGGE